MQAFHMHDITLTKCLGLLVFVIFHFKTYPGEMIFVCSTLSGLLAIFCEAGQQTRELTQCDYMWQYWGSVTIDPAVGHYLVLSGSLKSFRMCFHSPLGWLDLLHVLRDMIKHATLTQCYDNFLESVVDGWPTMPQLHGSMSCVYWQTSFIFTFVKIMALIAARARTEYVHTVYLYIVYGMVHKNVQATTAAALRYACCIVMSSFPLKYSTIRAMKTGCGTRNPNCNKTG